MPARRPFAVAGLAAACLALAAGARPAAAQTVLYTVYGDGAQDAFGGEVAGVGDADGDGAGDLLVGAHWDDDNGTNCGSVRLFSGVDGAVLWTVHGIDAHDRFGISLAGAGDVDGDGLSDVIAGGYENSAGPGYARVLAGRDGAVLHTFLGDAFDDQFGVSVDGAGDVDGDGVPDLVVGARKADAAGAQSGRVTLYSGAGGQQIRHWDGDGAGDEFGHDVADLGDVDGDGVPDLAVGAWLDDDGGADAGSVRVLSGADGAELYTLHGEAPGAAYGWSVAGPGDVDGDGRGDLLVGAPQWDGFRGKTYLHSGADGALLDAWEGDDAGDSFGYSVAGAGDWDTDGVPDLMVGAYRDDDGGTGSGTVLVLSGAVTGAGRGVLQKLVGDDAGDQFGKGVDGVGDVNADGVDDVVVGAWVDDDGAPDAGSARVYAGPLPPLADAGFALPGAAGTPTLDAAGTLLPGTPLALALSDTVPSGSFALVVGLGTALLPFKGGTLVPEPTLLLSGLPLDASGAAALAGIWPPGVPSGTMLAVQAWIPDAGGPAGFAASNAVTGAVP